jgi:hypothetical protein
MNRRGPLFTKLTLATVGLALIWSAARADGPHVDVSLCEMQSLSRSERPTLPAIPVLRLERMPNTPSESSREAPAKFVTLATGEQIAAILRPAPLTSAAIEPPRHGGTESSEPELATRNLKSKLK